MLDRKQDAEGVERVFGRPSLTDFRSEIRVDECNGDVTPTIHSARCEVSLR